MKGLLEKKRLTAEMKKGADEVAWKGAAAWRGAGEYANALAFYDGLSTSATSAKTRVEALGGAIACLAAVKKQGEIPARLKAMRKELAGMEGKEREPYERWVVMVEKEIGLQSKNAVGRR